MHKLLANALTKQEQAELIDHKLAWILQASQPLKIILFGSAARWELTDCSDIDLILIYSTAADKKAGQSAIYKARPPDDWPHDLLFYTEAEYRSSIVKGGGAAYIAEREGRTVFPMEIFE